MESIKMESIKMESIKMESIKMLACPLCRSKNVGKIKTKHYFCRECFSELELEKTGFTAYEIDVDGGLKAVEKSA
ncbi:MAG: hypothetical protein M0021_14375 [Clostridia bacterium]|nr:hypothetical protein [Clostridia bacterium]